MSSGGGEPAVVAGIPSEKGSLNEPAKVKSWRESLRGDGAAAKTSPRFAPGARPASKRGSLVRLPPSGPPSPSLSAAAAGSQIDKSIYTLDLSNVAAANAEDPNASAGGVSAGNTGRHSPAPPPLPSAEGHDPSGVTTFREVAPAAAVAAPEDVVIAVPSPGSKARVAPAVALSSRSSRSASFRALEVTRSSQQLDPIVAGYEACLDVCLPQSTAHKLAFVAAVLLVIGLALALGLGLGLHAQ